MISPSYSGRYGERRWPHVGASKVDPLLAALREETHDWREVEQAVPTVGEGHTKGGRREKEMIMNNERAGGGSTLLGLCALHWAFWFCPYILQDL
ncbi:unnamed protein product [Spirodela intermedia]|uniref:Uncharacterized protein n=1 Tax=Spirodela intermedia TaxID=51605 RepID=A0A7I8LJM9_SPIIN|nr:unnamed protein product [Spirodela intermedia]